MECLRLLYEGLVAMQTLKTGDILAEAMHFVFIAKSGEQCIGILLK
jgi:hypothetical protein